MGSVTNIAQCFQGYKVYIDDIAFNLFSQSFGALVLFLKSFCLFFEFCEHSFDVLLLLSYEEISLKSVSRFVFLLATFVPKHSSRCCGFDMSREVVLQILFCEIIYQLLLFSLVSFNINAEQGVPQFYLSCLGSMFKLLAFCEFNECLLIFLIKRLNPS